MNRAARPDHIAMARPASGVDRLPVADWSCAFATHGLNFAKSVVITARGVSLFGTTAVQRVPGTPEHVRSCSAKPISMPYKSVDRKIFVHDIWIDAPANH
jgi:hypothetical protein